MQKIVIDTIDKKAAKQYAKMTEIKREAYRAMLYAGAQVTVNGRKLKDVADELGYSESGAHKLVTKWLELLNAGDVTANLVATAIQRLRCSPKFSDVVAAKKTGPMDAAETARPKTEPCVRRTGRKRSARGIPDRCLGFVVTPEDEMRYRAAVRSAIIFMRKYGRGISPRVSGEYYAPGTKPQPEPSDEDKWLPIDVAAPYCGCDASVITEAGKRGHIERRVYKQTKCRIYYEYKVSDLDQFINAGQAATASVKPSVEQNGQE